MKDKEGNELEIINEFWNLDDREKTNFQCILTNEGYWHIDMYFGKWLFLIKPKNDKILAATLQDHKNIFTGILEVERRNDIFEHNGFFKHRPPQKYKTFYKFKETLDCIDTNWKNGENKTI
jgi:hypothetical protein